MFSNISDEKETHTVDFSYFSDLDQIFQTFHFNRSVPQSSTNLCLKIYLICSKLESVISLEIREDQTRKSRIQMLHYELWPPSACRHAVQRRRTRQKKKRIQKDCFCLEYFFLSVTMTIKSAVDGVQRVCAQMVVISNHL